MSNKFIFKTILFRVIIINQKSGKDEKFRANLDNNNNENNLQYTLKMVKIKNSDFLNSYIYIDINKIRKNLYIKFILAINNL